MSSAARLAPTREWFTHFFDDSYVTELSAQKPSGQTRREVEQIFEYRKARVDELFR